MANLTSVPFDRKLPFNPKFSTRLHIDLNSCFATIEQQANPFLRNKPMGVGAYVGPGGCIIAPSIEAKQLGIKTGFRVKDAQLIAPNITIVASDPAKYRVAHLRLKKLLLEYTDSVEPKSIDEFVLDLEGYPAFKKGIHNVALEIKQRIKQEIGDWVRVNVGIAPNRFLAKTAAGLHKPDGLDEININNYNEIFSKLVLTDLCGIERRYAARLHSAGIYSVLDFFNAEPQQLKYAFHSIIGFDWYYRLKGWEVDDIEYPRKSFGNSYALPVNLSTPHELAPILMKLVDKTAWRMRKQGFKARGIHISLAFRSGNHWHQALTTDKVLYDTADIYKEMFRLLCRCPYREPVRVLSECVFSLAQEEHPQLELFDNLIKKDNMVKAVDSLKARFGSDAVMPATMLKTEDFVPDRVAFGSVKELLDYIVDDDIDEIDTCNDDIYPVQET